MGDVMTRDALGRIFKIEKSLGRSDVFDINFHYDGRPDVVRSFHHEHKDGLGALRSSLWDLHQYRLLLPRFHMKSGGLFRYFAGILAMLSDFSPSIIKWKKFEKDWGTHPGARGFRVLSRDSTKNLLTRLKERELPFNAWLLFIINQIVADSLAAAEETKFRWLFPVNVRSTVEEQTLESNFTSSVGLTLKRGDSLEIFKAHYKTSLIASRIKASHFLATFVASLPERWLLKLAIARGQKNMWVGSYSNVGRWDFSELDDAQSFPSAISLAPPAGTPCFPIGVGIITWRGRLSICLRLHPCLIDHDEIHEDLLDKILTSMSDDLRFPCHLSQSSREHTTS